MLIITFLSFLLFLILVLARTAARRAPFFILATFLLSWLILESSVYVYFLHEIHCSKGENFLLMGNQKILDALMKHKINKAIQKKDKTNIYQVDDQLGYTVTADFYNKDGLRQTNGAGLRGDKDYPIAPSDSKLRMVAFGDSFVFGDGEKAQDVWPYILEQNVENLEVLNFGVSGYGLGQSSIRYLKEGVLYQPDIIFFNYVRITERDQVRARELLLSQRSMTDSALFRVRFWKEGNKLLSKAMTPLDLFNAEFRNKYIFGPYGISETEGILSSPIFKISNLGLLIKKIVLEKKISQRMADIFEEDTQLNIQILDEILKTASKTGSQVIFFIREPLEELPNAIKQEIYKYRDNVTYLNAKFLIPARVAFHHENFDHIMNSTGHFNRKGNEIYAEVLEAVLKSREWGKGDRHFKYQEDKKAFENLAK